MYVGGRPVELWEIDHSWNKRPDNPGSAGRWPASPGAAPVGADANRRPALPPTINAAPCAWCRVTRVLAHQRVPRGLVAAPRKRGRHASVAVARPRKEWWAPLPRGATPPQAAIHMRGVSPRAPRDAPFGSSPCAPEPSAGSARAPLASRLPRCGPCQYARYSIRGRLWGACIDAHGELEKRQNSRDTTLASAARWPPGSPLPNNQPCDRRCGPPFRR